jgi:hypothetical protein
MLQTEGRLGCTLYDVRLCSRLNAQSWAVSTPNSFCGSGDNLGDGLVMEGKAHLQAIFTCDFPGVHPLLASTPQCGFYVEIIEAVSKIYAERRIVLWRNGSIRCL